MVWLCAVVVKNIIKFAFLNKTDDSADEVFSLPIKVTLFSRKSFFFSSKIGEKHRGFG